MKTKSLALLILVLIGFTACQDKTKKKAEEKTETGKNIGSLYLSKAQPQPGDQMVVKYKLDSAQKEDSVKAFYYVLNHKEVLAKDLEMKQSGSTWKGEITIPDSAKAIGFNIKVGGEFVSNNKKGFVQPLYTEKGEIVPGGKASKAKYYMGPGGWADLQVNPDSIRKWMMSDMKAHPQIKTNWRKDYARYLMRNARAEAKKYVRNQNEFLNKREGLTENDYETLVYFHRILNNEKKVDSIRKVAAKAYPKGKAARVHFVIQFKRASSYQEKQDVLEEYKKRIGKAGRYKNYLLNSLARMAQSNSDWKAYQNYLSQLSSPVMKARNYNNTAWQLAEEGENLKVAAQLAKKATKLTSPETAEKNLDKRDSNLSPSQYKKRVNRINQTYQDTYALVLFKQGKVKQAIAHQKKAIGAGKDIKINQRLIKYLMKAERYEKVVDKASNFIVSNAANSSVKEDYKTAFKELNNSGEELKKTLASLEKKARQKAMKALKSEMFTKEAPDFKLKDLQGNTISLASLKGKTVILDFWATWCGPCRKSFPGMEKAVKYYQDKKDVKLFFVNTFQREKPKVRKNKVSGFIKQNDYPFHVLIDPKKDGEFTTASDYGITGIPTKIIIGPDGKWHFTKVGYSGSNEKLVKELKMMVELTQS